MSLPGNHLSRKSERCNFPGLSLRTRFMTSLLVLFSIGMTLLITQLFFQAGWNLLHFVAGLMTWCKIHSTSLTRHKRAHFDESNILETYQPRARTHGHLFQSDPPTPAPIVKFIEADKSNQTDSEKASFYANRDAHYASEYNYIMQANKEQDALDRMGEIIDAKSSKSMPIVEEPILVEFKEPTEEDDEENF